MGQLKTPFTVIYRAGKGPFGMPEQFTFNNLPGKGPAGYLHKRLVFSALISLVYGMGYHSLSGSALPAQQNGGPGIGNAFDHGIYIFHLGAVAHQAIIYLLLLKQVLYKSKFLQ